MTKCIFMPNCRLNNVTQSIFFPANESYGTLGFITRNKYYASQKNSKNEISESKACLASGKPS